MIQRIQSFYLLLTTVLSILFLKGAYLTFFDNSGSHIELMLTGLYKLNVTGESVRTGGTLEIFIPAILIPSISIITIFLFKKRDIQINLTRILILIISVFLVASIARSSVILSKYDATPDSWYKIATPLLQLLFSILALRGIKKDNDLVKSYDRLR